MRPGDRNQVPTVSSAVSKAAAICDPEQAEDAVAALVASFEDDDRPATAAEDLRGELSSAARAIAPEGPEPAADATAAVAFWLATNFDQSDDRERAIREATRLVFGDDLPPGLADWLEARDIAV